jgi:hypothetical protein
MRSQGNGECGVPRWNGMQCNACMPHAHHDVDLALIDYIVCGNHLVGFSDHEMETKSIDGTTLLYSLPVYYVVSLYRTTCVIRRMFFILLNNYTKNTSYLHGEKTITN